MSIDQRSAVEAAPTARKGKPSAVLLAVLTLLATSALRAESQDDPWQFAVTPYLWLPYIDAQLGFETGGSGGSTVDMSDLLKHLSGAFFLSAEASKGRWGLEFDAVYVGFGKEDSKVTSVAGPGGAVEVPVNAGTTTDLTGYTLSLMGSYTQWESAGSRFDLLGGLRYTHIGATLDWSFTAGSGILPARTGSASTGVDLWDAVVGLRGRAALGSSAWFVPYYLDAGTGTSTFTWQALLGIGYSFHCCDLLLAYRTLSFEQGSHGSAQHLNFSGPALGVTFRF